MITFQVLEEDMPSVPCPMQLRVSEVCVDIDSEPEHNHQRCFKQTGWSYLRAYRWHIHSCSRKWVEMLHLVTENSLKFPPKLRYIPHHTCNSLTLPILVQQLNKG